MQFIDRVKEQRRLKEALSSDAPAFIVLFGRRRLGKSTLIRNVLNESVLRGKSEQTSYANHPFIKGSCVSL